MATRLPHIVLNDFSGGVNTRDNPFNLQADELRDALNMTLAPRGAISQRGGLTRFDTAGMPAAKRAEFMRPWNTSSFRVMLLSIDGTIYKMDTAGVLTSLFVGTAGTVWCMEQMQNSAGADFMYCCNGTDTPKKISTAFAVTDWTTVATFNPTMCRTWRNYMVVSGYAAQRQRLYFSKLADPDTFTPASDFADVRSSEDDLDPNTWLDLAGDNLVVFKTGSVWRVTSPPSQVAMNRVGAPGCLDRFMSAALDEKVYFWSEQGLYSLDARTDGLVIPMVFESTKIDNWIAENFNYAQTNKVRLAVSEDRKLYCAIPTGGSSTNNRLLEYVPYLLYREQGRRRYGAWMIHDISVASLSYWRPSTVPLMIGSPSVGGKLYRLFNGTNDDGAAISSYALTAWQAISPEEYFERLRRVNVVMEGGATLSVFGDFAEASIFSEILEAPSTPSDALWDGGTWNDGVWDTVGQQRLKRVRPETRSRYHSLKVANSTLDQGLVIYSIEMVYRGAKEHT